MKSEIEVKFLDINIDETREKLKALNGKCKEPMRLMRRVVVETPEMKEVDAFVRVRDEGGRITMTYKQFDSHSVDGAREAEVTVDNFDSAVQLVDALCPVTNRRSYQESKRETWEVESCEVMIDEWPWIKPYLEIEGRSEDDLRTLAQNLDLEWESGVFGDVMAAYRAEYTHLTMNDTVGDLAEVKFGDPLPDMLHADRIH